MSTQNNNGNYYNVSQYSNYPNGQQIMNSQQMYMQYQQQPNPFNVSPGQIPPPLDPVQYQNYRTSQTPQKATPNLQQQHSQKPGSWSQASFQFGVNPIHNIQASSQQNMNYSQYENLPYKPQYQNKTDSSAPSQAFQSSTLHKQKMGDNEHLNPRQAFEYIDNPSVFPESSPDCNQEMQQYQFSLPQALKGSDKPMDTLINIDREISKERSKLRDCVSEDCRLVLGEVQKLEGPFTLYNINGSKYYSIREVLAHLLPYHLYNFDLTAVKPENPKIKKEPKADMYNQEMPTTSEIDKLRSRIDALSQSEDPSIIWNCYKTISNSIMTYNQKTNDPAQATDDQVNASMDVQQMNRPRTQPTNNYPRRVNYIQYMGNNTCPTQPHNNSQ